MRHSPKAFWGAHVEREEKKRVPMETWLWGINRDITSTSLLGIRGRILPKLLFTKVKEWIFKSRWWRIVREFMP